MSAPPLQPPSPSTTPVDLLLSPADLDTQCAEDLSETTCVVFDILRATSTMATALHNGAREMVVVGEIDDALRWRASDPHILLAGERNGQRISADLTGSIPFDLGNSPREFVRDRILDRRIVITTTNGTRALQACRGAASLLAASFLNLQATARALLQQPGRRIRLIPAGTGAQTSFEDLLGAGALLAELSPARFTPVGDACLLARHLYETHKKDLLSGFAASTNGRRLLNDPALAPDVAYCTQRDIVPGIIRIHDQIARLEPVPEPASNNIIA